MLIEAFVSDFPDCFVCPSETATGPQRYRLRPHHVSFNKRLVKMPKLYFYDVGLVSWLLGVWTPEQMETHPLRRNIFETFIISELIKSKLNRRATCILFLARQQRQ